MHPQALDHLIWYLRLVHSIDYYNGMAFPSEDCMPHRCGIFTVRPQKPNAATQDEGDCTYNSLSLSVYQAYKYRIAPNFRGENQGSTSNLENFVRKHFPIIMHDRRDIYGIHKNCFPRNLANPPIFSTIWYVSPCFPPVLARFIGTGTRRRARLW